MKGCKKPNTLKEKAYNYYHCQNLDTTCMPTLRMRSQS